MFNPRPNRSLEMEVEQATTPVMWHHGHRYCTPLTIT